MDLIYVTPTGASRTPIPEYLEGLDPESLADLSWTDPSLGLQGCAWWPGVDESEPLGPYERYGEETLEVDAARQVVVIRRAVIAWTTAEIITYNQQALAPLVSLAQGHLDGTARKFGYRDIQSAVTYADEPGVAQYQEASQALRAWRSQLRLQWETMRDEILAGTRLAPAPADFLALLPEAPVPDKQALFITPF
jgi:hypothetical protein